MKVRLVYSSGKGVALETPFFVGRVPGSEDVAVFKVKGDPGTERLPCSGNFEVLDVIGKDLKVSRCHVRVLEDEGSLLIVDHGPLGKGSTNGTSVGGYGTLTKGGIVKVRDFAVVSIPSSEPSITFVIYPLETEVPYTRIIDRIYMFRKELTSTSSPTKIIKITEEIRSYMEVILKHEESERLAGLIEEMMKELDDALTQRLPPMTIKVLVEKHLDKLWNALFGI